MCCVLASAGCGLRALRCQRHSPPRAPSPAEKAFPLHDRDPPPQAAALRVGTTVMLCRGASCSCCFLVARRRAESCFHPGPRAPLVLLLGSSGRLVVSLPLLVRSPAPFAASRLAPVLPSSAGLDTCRWLLSLAGWCTHLLGLAGPTWSPSVASQSTPAVPSHAGLELAATHSPRLPSSPSLGPSSALAPSAVSPALPLRVTDVHEDLHVRHDLGLVASSGCGLMLQALRSPFWGSRGRLDAPVVAPGVRLTNQPPK